jgi:hypothetical protein
MSKTKTTKKQQVINWFLKHPLATPRVVSEKFSMALPTVYTLRKQATALDKKAENARELGLDYEPQVVAAPVIVETPQASTRQVGGDHYVGMGVQPWDVVDTWPRDQRIGYYRGGALKYLMRMGSKDESPIEVAKGQHYIQKLLEVLQEQD